MAGVEFLRMANRISLFLTEKQTLMVFEHFGVLCSEN